MSGGGPEAPAPHWSIGTIVMMVAGVLLLLPGLCTIVFAALLVADKPSAPFSDPYVQVFVPFMVVCLLVALAGVLLIRAARRRRRRGQGGPA